VGFTDHKALDKGYHESTCTDHKLKEGGERSYTYSIRVGGILHLQAETIAPRVKCKSGGFMKFVFFKEFVAKQKIS
jgi:hypothetical protein